MNTNNWKWFRYNEVFVIKKGKRLTKANMIDGNIPYVGATDSNNGITARISNNEHLHSGNTISVSYNGSIAEAYYQAKEFWATDDVNVLYPLFPMTPYSAIFFTTLINKEKYRFNYGRKWDKELMNISKIKLPIDSKGNPDWQWIENYVKETLIPKLPIKAKAVWQKQFNTMPLSNKVFKLRIDTWKWFKTGDVLDCSTTKHAIQQDLSEGDTLFVTRSAENNGVSAYIDATNCVINDPNCITIGAEGVFAFYQPKVFVTGVKVYTLRHEKLNKYNALFISTLLNKENYRYNYGNARILDKIKKERIKLPVDANGNPDWQFMEDYIKSLPYSACL